MGFSALKLGAEIGDDVTELLPRKHQEDQRLRTKEFCVSLSQEGQLSASFRVPNAASDIELTADLRSRQSIVSTAIAAPSDKGAKGRIGWLTRQLANAPADLVIEAYSKNSRLPISATLSEAREDSLALLGAAKKEPTKFKLLLRRDLAMNRRDGTRPGFAGAVQSALKTFYGCILQDLTEYRLSAPKIKTRPEPAPAVQSHNGTAKPQTTSPQHLTLVGAHPIQVLSQREAREPL